MKIPGDSGEKVGKRVNCREGWDKILQLRARASLRVDGGYIPIRYSLQVSEGVKGLLNLFPDKALPWASVIKATGLYALPLSCPRTPVHIPSLLQAL